MKLRLSYNVPTLPGEHYLATNGWQTMDQIFDSEEDFNFFTIANYSGIIWKDGIRNSKNFVGSYCIIIDYDNKNDNNITTIEEVENWIRDWDVKYLIVNSKSHTPERPKFHILFPFKKPCFSTDMYSAIMHATMHRLCGEPDGSVHDLARFMGYTPKEKLQAYAMYEGEKYLDEWIVPTESDKKMVEKSFKSYKKDLKDNWKIHGRKTWSATDEMLPLIISEKKHIINCPIGEGNAHTHGEDRNESAFLDFSQDSKNWYVYCSVCSPALNGGKVFWMKKDYEFVQKIMKYNKGVK